jgi:hypothetical protein
MTLITGLLTADTFIADQTHIPVRQENATGNKTRDLTADRLLEGVTASITNLTTDVDDLQASIDAAIPLAQKAAANGVATLDATGKIPAAQLNITGLSFKGYWNATTNSPTLIDGIGAAGDYYLIQVTTGDEFTRDLGSGDVDWTKDGYALYDGTKYIENEATNKVISVNGLQGAVDLDADDIDATVSKEFVTPDQRDAMDAADSPAAGNEFITRSALDNDLAALTSGIVVIGGAYTPDNFNHPDFEGGTGENKILSVLGISQAAAEARWPLAKAHYGGSIDTSITSLDDVRFASWLEGLRYGIIYDLEVLPNKAYAFNRGGLRIYGGKDTPINNTDSQQYHINFKNSIYKNQSGSPFTGGMFYRTPESQTDANSNYIDNRIVISGGKFEGVDSTDIGFKIGASRSPEFRNMELQNFMYAFQGSMLLNADFHKINTASCARGIYCSIGWWTSANVNNSITQATFHRCRHRLDGSTQIGIYISAFDTLDFDSCQIEGTGGDYAIFFDVSSAATVNKHARIFNLRGEIGNSTKFTSAIIGYRGRSTRRLVIDTVFTQDASAAADTILLDCQNTQGTMNYKIAGILENTGSGSFKLKQTNSGGKGTYSFEDVHFLGSPTTAAQHIAPGNQVWTADSDLPDDEDLVTIISPYKA